MTADLIARARKLLAADANRWMCSCGGGTYDTCEYVCGCGESKPLIAAAPTLIAELCEALETSLSERKRAIDELIESDDHFRRVATERDHLEARAESAESERDDARAALDDMQHERDRLRVECKELVKERNDARAALELHRDALNLAHVEIERLRKEIAARDADDAWMDAPIAPGVLERGATGPTYSLDTGEEIDRAQRREAIAKRAANAPEPPAGFLAVKSPDGPPTPEGDWSRFSELAKNARIIGPIVPTKGRHRGK